jgi:hypothetical protein
MPDMLKIIPTAAVLGAEIAGVDLSRALSTTPRSPRSKAPTTSTASSSSVSSRSRPPSRSRSGSRLDPGGLLA